MDEEFVQQLDDAILAHGLGDRAKFIRAAIGEKLLRCGIQTSLAHINGGSRAGKGGPKRSVKYPPYRDQSELAEDKPMLNSFEQMKAEGQQVVYGDVKPESPEPSGKNVSRGRSARDRSKPAPSK